MGMLREERSTIRGKEVDGNESTREKEDLGEDCWRK